MANNLSINDTLRVNDARTYCIDYANPYGSIYIEVLKINTDLKSYRNCFPVCFLYLIVPNLKTMDTKIGSQDIGFPAHRGLLVSILANLYPRNKYIVHKMCKEHC